MNTDCDGGHNSLDWNKAKGKTKLLSIHGDKGRGHKVVFFVGLTEGSIPRDIFIYKSSELIPESLLNVGLSRSTKYLFVGINFEYPSRYI
jgi:superfamily I DNA/RNA helicase